MKKIIISAIIILLCGILIFYKFKSALVVPQRQSVIITNLENKKIVINVELADTPRAQIQGLSDRKKLEDGYGMLFVFADKQNRNFWMKNMHFPLDIIWLEDQKIVKISDNLPPEGESPQKHYLVETPVNYVLEVPAGFCKKHKIEIGNQVFYNY
jgi:uncharacterized protein